MKEINLVFGKGVIIFNTVSREASGSFPLNDWLKMFCGPYSWISASLTVIDSITFVKIDAIDTTFEEFDSFIFVVSKDFAHVVGIDASGSDMVFFKNINYFVANSFNVV